MTSLKSLHHRITQEQNNCTLFGKVTFCSLSIAVIHTVFFHPSYTRDLTIFFILAMHFRKRVRRKKYKRKVLLYFITLSQCVAHCVVDRLAAIGWSEVRISLRVHCIVWSQSSALFYRWPIRISLSNIFQMKSVEMLEISIGLYATKEDKGTSAQEMCAHDCNASKYRKNISISSIQKFVTQSLWAKRIDSWHFEFIEILR